MNDRCATVTIVTENGPVVINATDYVPGKHALAEGSEQLPLSGGQGAAQGPAGTVGEPLAPAADVSPPAAPGTRLVAKKGKRFVVVDPAGNAVEAAGIDPTGYTDEASAWAAAYPPAVQADTPA